MVARLIFLRFEQQGTVVLQAPEVPGLSHLLSLSRTLMSLLRKIDGPMNK